MSYIVLARKWRPQNLDDLAGQEPVVKTIKNALSKDKIAHAYLFSGPRGVGKTSAARILAKMLNCSSESSINPCDTCQSCKAIIEGASLDVFEIDGASNTGVDDVRELREAVKYAPSSGKYKVYIIDEVHMLSTQAFNALLKTLEEPPPHVIFIFATTEPKKVPATIISRCQHHAFRRISKGKIKDQLTKISETENIKIKAASLETIARAADGSMRDALTILDKASSFSDDINEQELQILLGLPETDIILNLSDTILSGDISRTLTSIKELTERGYDLRPIIKGLVEHFRNIAIVKVIQKPDEFLEFTQEEIQKLQQQASNINLEELTLLLTELLKLEAEVRNSANPRYSLELGLLRTSFIKGMTSIKDILNKLDKTDGPASPPSINKTGAPSHRKESIPQENPDLSDNKDKIWSETMEKIKSEDHLLAYKLEEAKIINITKTELTMGFNGGMSVFADSVRKNANLVETAVKNITGNKLRLKIILLPEKEKNIHEINPIREISNGVKDEILANPVFKNAMELFNGEILEIKSLKNKDENS